MPLLTYTDRVLLPEPCIADDAVPSLLDIAVSLSRQPRFGGHTRRWWSVLDHLLFCDALVSRPGIAKTVRLALLLHDAHECVTADVPTDAKSPALRMLQADLDRALMNRYFPGGYGAYYAHRETVKQIDMIALKAEAVVVGPPVTVARLVEVEPRFALDTQLERNAAEMLKSYLRGMGPNDLGQPPYTDKQEAHPAVTEYLSRITKLM